MQLKNATIKIFPQFVFIMVITCRWVYEGEWKDDKKTGYGVLRSHRGATFEGTWLESTQDGYGVETYADGGIYHAVLELYLN